MNHRVDKHAGLVYTTSMIHLTASFWYYYFNSSLAAGGFRSI
ncbi:hypothetical protein [Rhodopseudomonas pseudopalustris]|uniref:Uncharacterized protein n=1 Tax=Rhodopseudomonas pseudopalustris TaxID=1513892 RepID=A0A1H8U500_9BRAD|nr:hypothetical protein [Rhodopseudomonas pseudopalustris]SEO97914.1 hypothetical protein SAMN05444123_106276 [Rhodopseudomonas pseudopalustris]